MSLPELPVSAEASVIVGDRVHFIEVQLSDDGWNVNGSDSIKNLDDLEDEIRNERKKFERLGRGAFVLIEAHPSVRFDRIRTLIRTSAKAGVSQFLFATKQHKIHPDELESALTLSIPVIMGCGPAPVLAPLFIKADSDGQIFVNTGPAQELIETDTSTRKLAELRIRLEGYTACARAGSVEPHCQIYINQSCSYQRFIDVLSALTAYRIRRYQFTDLPDIYGSKGCTIPGPTAKPRKPEAPLIRNPIHPPGPVDYFPGR